MAHAKKKKENKSKRGKIHKKNMENGVIKGG